MTQVKTVERMCGVSGRVRITLPAEPWALNARRWVPPATPSQRPRPGPECIRANVAAHLADREGRTANEIAAAIGVSERSVRNALRALQKKGVVEVSGFRPGSVPGRWRMTK